MYCRGDLKEKRSLATLANGLEISISQFSKPLASYFFASTQKMRKQFFLHMMYILIIRIFLFLFDIKTRIKQGKKVRTISQFNNNTNDFGKEKNKSISKKLTRSFFNF